MSAAVALDVYGRALASSQSVHAVEPEGARARLPLERWVGCPSACELALLAHAHGPVLDVGCGPGRHVEALVGLGIPALGIDLSPEAVALALARGAPALQLSVFGDVPDPGTWRSALLLDGNIGIGGDPARLLRRIRELLAAAGEVLVELDPPEVRSRVVDLRLEGPGGRSKPFRWARVSAADIAAIGTDAGFAAAELWTNGGRWFARLSPA